MKHRISAVLLGTALAFGAGSAAFAQDKTIKIGVLTDNSGLYSDLGGAGSTLAAQMAVEDSGLAAKGWKIDVISADHQNKPDIATTIARLKSEGFTILLVEQNFRFASTVADRYYIVEHGKVIDGFANSELSANMDKLHTYLGV